MKRTITLLGILFLSACSDTGTTPSVTTLDGSSFNLAKEIEGKPTILNFWASWCAFCATELPAFERYHQSHPNVNVIAINLQESPQKAKQYWLDGKYSFMSILDPKSELKTTYNVITQPTTIFLNAKGDTVERRDGPLSESELNAFAEKISPTPSFLPSGTETDEVQTSSTPGFLQRWSKQYKATVKHTVNFDDVLSGGVPKDGIPALDNPTFVSMSDADKWLDEADTGSVYMGPETIRFYPFRILNWHEIVNDNVDGETIFVTYCPLCDSAAVYDRGDTTYGVSGFLMNSNLMMYDRETESLWNQITGKAVVGKRTGEILELLPSNVIEWKTVKEHYPNVEVLSRKTGYNRDYDRSPYSDYMAGDQIMFPVAVIDDRLENKERILGISVNGKAKAYPRNMIEDQNVSDTLNGSTVTITWSNGRSTFTVDGEVVEPIHSFWFSWVAQYPETAVYSE